MFSGRRSSDEVRVGPVIRKRQVGGGVAQLPPMPAGPLVAARKQLQQQQEEWMRRKAKVPTEKAPQKAQVIEEEEDFMNEPLDDRPSSSSSSSSNNNPAQTDFESVFEGMLTEEKLQVLTGVEDLHLVLGTELFVDATATPISLIGTSMPNLVELRFTGGSNIPSVQEISPTKLTLLQVMWAPKCKIARLDGVQFLTALRELYAPYNMITSLMPLSSLAQLEVADFEGNLLASLEEIVDTLRSLANLTSINLAGNPFLRSFTTLAEYRKEFHAACRGVQVLDDVSFVEGQQEAHQDPTTEAFDKDLREMMLELDVLTESLKQTGEEGMAPLVAEQHRSLNSRQTTSCAGARRRPPPKPAGNPTAIPAPPSPHSSFRQSKIRSAPTEASLQTTPQRQSHSSDGVSPHKPKRDDSSSMLTRGKVAFSGSLVRNLRGRKDHAPSTLHRVEQPPPQRTYDSEEEEPIDEPVSDGHYSAESSGSDNAPHAAEAVDEPGDELRDARRQLEELKHEARPQFLSKYSEMLKEMGEEQDRGKKLKTQQIVEAVRSQKEDEARQLRQELLEGQGQFETIGLSDLGTDSL